MAYEKKPETGALFKNDRKESDRHPDYKGDALIGGVEYWMSAWINQSQSTGQTYMSFKFNPKDDQGQPNTQQRQPEPQTQGGPAMDPDDIPFNHDAPRDI